MKLSQRKVEEACGCGNNLACQILTLKRVMFAGAKVSFSDVEVKDKDHPNKLPFTGVLLLLDTPSTKPPHGARGHRILVPTKAAEKALDSLVGMGVNYTSSLDSHAPQKKVGVITRAWIDGKKVKVEGIIYKKDFPEAERDLRKPGMGMSMELADVFVRDDNEPIWYLQDFQFTGATILYKDAAAYYGTSLAARAAARKGEARMAQPDKKKKVAAAGAYEIDYDKLGAAIGKAVSAQNQPLIESVTASVEKIGKRVDELAEVVELQASAAGGTDVDDDDEPLEVSAAKHEDEDDEDEDDDDMDAKASDDDDPSEDDPSDQDEEEELDAMEDLEEKAPHSKPGEVNHAMKTKGRKSTTTDVGAEAFGKKPFPGLKSRGVSASARTVLASIQAKAERAVKKIELRAAAAEKKNRKLQGTIGKLQAQVERYAEAEERRSISQIPRDVSNLAAKAGVDLREIQASGQPMTTEQVDQILATVDLDPTTKMTMKNKLLQAGLMEQGQINRGFNVQ